MSDLRKGSIRNLEKGDSVVIDFIRKRLEWYWHMDVQDINEEYIEPSFLGGFPYIFIAFTETGEWAGKIFLTKEEEGFLGIHGQPWVNALFVREEFRGHGIARMLIQRAEEKCRELGYQKLYLDTTQAEEYYRKLGSWQKLGTAIWGKFEEVTTVMVKEL